MLTPNLSSGQEVSNPVSDATTPVSLEETRLTMDKWIETQQIISKERKDWQQGKDLLLNRLELVKKEINNIKEDIAQADSKAVEATKKHAELNSENKDLIAVNQQLIDKVLGLESQMRQLHAKLPEYLQTKLQPLYQRIPEDTSQTRVSAAERYQNVLGILNELNKANNELTVNYEVHKLPNGQSMEVQALYVGLAQAYYVSARGDAGIGVSTDAGWKWEPSDSLAQKIIKTLDILAGKQSPEFVSLPVKIQ
jgi:hypothetical protein